MNEINEKNFSRMQLGSFVTFSRCIELLPNLYPCTGVHIKP